MGFDERHVLPSLRLMPYDRLVLVAGRETFRSSGFRRLKVLEPGLRTVRVDPFDLTDALEAWYCDPDPVRLPVLRGVSLAAAFSPSEGAIALALHGPIRHDRLVAAVAARGFARRTALGAIGSLAAKGLIEFERDDGTVLVRPSPRFALFRDQLRAVPKKA